MEANVKTLAAAALMGMMLAGMSASAGDDRYRSNPERFDATRRGREPHYAEGRVSRIDRWRDGYRVFIGGGGYPFFVSSGDYRRQPFRVGLMVRVGGYYNPLGYYDLHYRSDRYDRGSRGRYDGLRYSEATLKGVVKSIDMKAGTFVLYNEPTEGNITVVMLGRERWEDLRAGDHIELEGRWTRTGYFDAHGMSFVNDDERRD